MIYSKTFLPQNGKRYNQSFEYMFVFSKGIPKTFNPIKRPYSEKTLQRRKTKYTFNKHRGADNDGREIKEFGLKDDGVTKENVWHYTVGNMQSSKDKIAFQHPAIFPEQLANDHIISWSNEDDLIYDPFMGSGTTAKMAILNNRKYIGSEISEEYCKIAEQRLKMCGGLFFNSFETELSNEAGT
jgi:site-specific DNA-methyltransferase (adenine-specific)